MRPPSKTLKTNLNWARIRFEEVSKLLRRSRLLSAVQPRHNPQAPLWVAKNYIRVVRCRFGA